MCSLTLFPAASALTTVAASAQTANAVKNGDTKGAIQGGADTAAGVVGLFGGPVGRVFSAAYGVGQILDNASGASEFWSNALGNAFSQ